MSGTAPTAYSSASYYDLGLGDVCEITRVKSRRVYAPSHFLFLNKARSDTAICRCRLRSEPGGNKQAYRKVLRLCSMSSALCRRADGQTPVYEQQTAWQPPISNLSQCDASDRASLPFPVSESWSKLLSFEHLMYSDARVERVAVCPLVFFFDLQLCVRHCDRCDICSGQCDSRALVLPK